MRLGLGLGLGQRLCLCLGLGPRLCLKSGAGPGLRCVDLPEITHVPSVIRQEPDRATVTMPTPVVTALTRKFLIITFQKVPVLVQKPHLPVERRTRRLSGFLEKKAENILSLFLFAGSWESNT